MLCPAKSFKTARLIDLEINSFLQGGVRIQAGAGFTLWGGGGGHGWKLISNTSSYNVAFKALL